MRTDLTPQFERENKSRVRRGLEPYADVAAYLVAQGFSEAEARARAATSSPAKAEDAAGDASLDPAAVYEKSNASYRETVFGAAAEDGSDSASSTEAPAGEHDRREPEASAEELREFADLSQAVYSGDINACYRKATSGAPAK